MITVEYPCADGTPLVVRFTDEAQAATEWRLDRAHGRDPRTPLGDDLERAGLPAARQAYEDVGLLLPPSFDATPDAAGFPYFSAQPMTEEYLTRMMEGCGALVAEHGSALGIWHQRCLPQTKAAWDDIEAAGDRASLVELAGRQAYGFHMTMIPAYVCGNDLNLLAAAVQPLFGDEAGLVAHELAQGFPSPTLDADQRLWSLGRVAAADPDVVGALASPDVPAAMAALRSAGGAPAFFAAVDGFLAAYGLRAEGWDIACPRWSEQKAGFWAEMALLAAADAPAEPSSVLSAAADRRQALVDEITGRLADDEAALGRFQRRLARIEPYVFVREERALWQVALIGALRGAALRHGARLVAAGRLDDPEDVLFLRVEEVESSDGDGDLRPVAAARRGEHERWCRVEPPLVIGGGDRPEAAPTSSASAPTSTSTEGVLRGVPASRGVVTGTARVIVDLEDADRLEPGDVLVCVMTSPPWTPLFGVASAVVADTGELGSHPAIAAREYGIPCVLGVAAASRTIADGATVTVDGAAGTVTVA